MTKKKLITLVILMIAISTTFLSNGGLMRVRGIDLLQLIIFGVLLGVILSALTFKPRSHGQ